MGRKKDKPAYNRKTKPSSFVTTREAWGKLKSAERRTGKSRSDVITHCVMKSADSITRKDFDRRASKEAESEAADTASATC